MNPEKASSEYPQHAFIEKQENTVYSEISVRVLFLGNFAKMKTLPNGAINLQFWDLGKFMPQLHIFKITNIFYAIRENKNLEKFSNLQ